MGKVIVANMLSFIDLVTWKRFSVHFQNDFPFFSLVSQASVDLSVRVPGVGSTATFDQWMSAFIRSAIVLAVLIAFIRVCLAIYQLVMSGGNESALKSAKDSIFKSMGGLVLVILSSLILSVINPSLVGGK